MTVHRQARFAAAMGLAALLSMPAAHARDEEGDSRHSSSDESESAEDEDEDEAKEPSETEDEAKEPGEGEDEAKESSESAVADLEERAPAPPARRWARLWLGVAGNLDLVPMPSGRDLCALSPSGAPINTVSVYCTNPDGSDFPTRAQNEALIPGSSGRLDGGFTDGNLRVLFAADYAPLPALLIGARVGYAFNGYTGSAADKGFPAIDKNLHAELRLTYVFGSEPLTRVGFAPIVFLAAGASEFAARVTRFVSIDGRGDQPVDIWVVQGPWFAAAGAGARYQFSPRVAFTAAVRANTVFGDPLLLVVGPDLGVAYGF
jgi:hypothetical protein